MKERVNQLFKDKLTLVMLVLGLLTIVAAAGVISLQRGRTEESPYLNLEGNPEHLVDGDGEEQNGAGSSDAARKEEGAGQESTLAQAEEGSKGQASESEKEASQEEKKVEKGSLDQLAAAEEENISDKTVYGYGGDGLAAEAGAGLEAASGLVLNFGQTQSMMWPVEGNVLLDYNMDSTIFFPTLEQFKCNPGIVIQGEVSQPVAAPANARVVEAGINEEIGNYLVLDLGDEYSLTCGQLKEVQAVEGEYLEKGQILGYVAEPTKYYTLEGPNVFLELMKEGQVVDPLDYLE